MKAGAVFVDLTAAYDTVWYLGLTCMLLRLLPDKHMVRMIMKLIQNRSFTLTTGDSKPSRLRRLKNGSSSFQHIHLRSAFHNLQEVCYADDFTILNSSEDWKVLERTLSEDMTTLSAYLQTRRLKLSHAKTVTATFNLHNREAKRELKVKNNGKILPSCSVPTYLGVKLDRALAYLKMKLLLKLCPRKLFLIIFCHIHFANSEMIEPTDTPGKGNL